MSLLDAQEALLFRLLVSFFGEDRVVPFMSLNAVCGGALPSRLSSEQSNAIERDSQTSASKWARASRCLFTVVNEDDSPRLVIEFFEDFREVVDVRELVRRRYMAPVLSAAGVHYVTISAEELQDIIDPEYAYGLADFLEARLELLEQGVA